MTEQQPTSRQPDSFDPEAVGAALGVTPATAEDPARGPGVRYRLGVGQAISVFSRPRRHPDTLRAGQPGDPCAATVTDRQLVYEYRGGGEQVSLHASEHAVSLSYRLGEDTEATKDPWATDQPAPSPEPSPAQPAPSDPDTKQPTSAAAPADRQEAARYRTLTGRVGALPRFDTTTRGTQIARFPLAEHRGEETVWHRIVATDVRAHKLHELVDADASHSTFLPTDRPLPLADLTDLTLPETDLAYLSACQTPTATSG